MTAKRITPLAGVVSVVLGVVAIIGLGGDTPGGGDSAATVTRFYLDHHDRQSAAAYLLALAVVFLAFFAAAVHVALRGDPPERTGVGDVVFLLGAAIAGAGLVVAAALHLVLSEGVNDHLSSGAVEALNALDADDPIIFAAGTAIMLFGAAATMIPRRGILRWLGVIALVAAVGIFIPGVGFLGLLLAQLWIFATGITLTARPPGLEPATAV